VQIRAFFEMPHSLVVLKINLMASVLAGVFDLARFGHAETLCRGFMGFHFVAHVLSILSLKNILY